MAIWLVVLAAATVAAVECPVAECGALKDELCGIQKDGKIVVNSNPCPVMTSCSLVEMLHIGGSNGIPCKPSPLLLTNTTLPAAECSDRDKNRNFKSGFGHVECDTDADCVLTDDSMVAGSCQCSLRMNGRGLCVPDINNVMFEQYWKDCSGSELEGAELEFWSFYISQWIYLQTDLPCVSYFQEIDTVTSLYIAYQQSCSTILLSGFVLALWS